MKTGKKLLAAAVAVLLVLCMSLSVTATEFSGTTDYSQLQLALGMANGLNSYDYTQESWEPLQSAVDMGNRYYKGRYAQTYVNEAVTAIENATAALVKMDYSKLETALAAAYNKIDENPELHDVWVRIDAAVAESRPLLVSGDQAAVDAAVETLDALMEELAACAVAEQEPEVIIREVEVEVPPAVDYCNMPMHRTWPMLFAVSAAMNVGLIGGIVYIILKKRQTYDNTPLVSYDIDDDMDL